MNKSFIKFLTDFGPLVIFFYYYYDSGKDLKIAIPSFIIIGIVEKWIGLGYTPSIAWQVLAYVILTASEVLISITCLEFSYTQAPKTMKSFIMGLFLMSVALGNIFTAGVNAYILNADGTSILTGADYFYFFSKVMLLTAILFLFIVKYYKPRTYLHEEEKSYI